jgi:hypothetical protein
MSTELYPDRFCAFVDILGFRNLIARLTNSDPEVQSLRDILLRVHNPRVREFKDLHHVGYRTQSISDAVAVSVIPTIAGLLLLTRALEQLAMDLLALGYFVRGAIVRGRLYHDDSIIFGDALIRAYDLETTVVRYPRIMVRSDVLDGLNAKSPLVPAIKAAVRDSADGPRYIHVLREMEIDMKVWDATEHVDPPPTLHKYRDLKDAITRRFAEAVDTPAHFEKLQWFANYWNAVLPSKAREFRIYGPGLKTFGTFLGGG